MPGAEPPSVSSLTGNTLARLTRQDPALSHFDHLDSARSAARAAVFCARGPGVVAGLLDVIGVERVDFVSVPTRDLERSRRFYGEVLGLRKSRTNPDEFEAPNVTLALWQPEAQNVPFSANTAGIALRVADVTVAREQLAATGVEFLGDTVDTGVCLMGFFYDPDGNVLILHHRYAPPDR
jgi:catechol 2,3-dioxygenase-like lactoylglutathione lyase family enzyme